MSWIDDVAAGTLDLSGDWTTDLPTPGIPDANDMYDRTTKREIDLAKRVAPASQRVQMVQTASQNITSGQWVTLTSMSYTPANGGYQGVTGMAAISSGLLTMPSGSAGQWLATAQVIANNTSGVNAVSAAILQNSTQIIKSAAFASGSTGYQSAGIPGFEFTVADGDKIGLQIFITGTVNGSTVASNGNMSYLRLQKLP